MRRDGAGVLPGTRGELRLSLGGGRELWFCLGDGRELWFCLGGGRALGYSLGGGRELGYSLGGGMERLPEWREGVGISPWEKGWSWGSP